MRTDFAGFAARLGNSLERRCGWRSAVAGVSLGIVRISGRRDGYGITATVRLAGRTGVEMEALTAVSVAALTIYDMLKAADTQMTIGGIRVVRKRKGT